MGTAELQMEFEIEHFCKSEGAPHIFTNCENSKAGSGKSGLALIAAVSLSVFWKKLFVLVEQIITKITVFARLME